MKILHITLLKNWFRMELSGEKPEEYRKITAYWVVRLCEWSNGARITMREAERMIEGLIYGITQGVRFRLFDAVHAKNGYGLTSPFFMRRHLGTRIGFGNPAWGASDHQVFIIRLGQIIESTNTKFS